MIIIKRLYLERCISVGEVVNDSEGLLKPRATNAGIRYQLAHCLDHLIWNETCAVRTCHNKKREIMINEIVTVSLTCRWERTIDFPLVNSKFFLMKKYSKAAASVWVELER